MPRGLDRSVMAHLADGGWIARHENLLITGPTGLGKVGLPAPSGIRLAGMGGRSSINAPRVCSKPSHLAALSASRLSDLP